MNEFDLTECERLTVCGGPVCFVLAAQPIAGWQITPTGDEDIAVKLKTYMNEIAMTKTLLSS